MNFKRVASGVCALALIAGMVAAPAADAGFKKALPVVVASAETYGDIEYYVDDDAVTITGYTGSPTEVTIPASIDGKSVTSIQGCAFYGCTSLTSITIPDSVTSIGDYAFWGCTSLTSIAIGNGVTSIGNCAFQNCTSLTNITLPNSLTSILDNAFRDCTSLTSITIPNSVTSISSAVFFNCTSLTRIDVESNNVNYCSVDGVLFNKDRTTLHTYPIGKKETSYTIPNSVTSIGDFAFWGCTGLTSITIPDSVTSICFAVFYNCTSLTDAYYNGTIAQWGEISFDEIEDGNAPLLNATIHCTDGDIVPSSDDSSTTDSQPDSQSDSSSQSDDSSKADPVPAKKSLSKAKVKAANAVYTGKALTPKVTVTLDGKTLSKGTDYTAAYKNNKNCGKATVTVTGKGSYTGSKSGSFVIKPGKVTAKKATSPKKQQVKVTWTKAKGGVTGYQVQIALDKKFKKSAKTYTVKKAKSTSKTIKKLKSKKTYYVRVRAYKSVGLKKYTGKWSAVKSVKTK